jgi:hypothetical protein
MSSSHVASTARLRLGLTDTQWDLLGLTDHRVRSDYEAHGLTVEGWVATGTVAGFARMRRHAACFENAESAGTRRSMRALVRKIDQITGSAS